MPVGATEPARKHPSALVGPRVRAHQSGRAEIFRAMAERYRESGRSAKRRILDEFVAFTGYHRKHAIRILNRQRPYGRPEGTRARMYDEAVKAALIVLWEASDRICGKRLKPLLPILADSLERHGHLQLDAAVRKKLLTVSAATIDRILAPTRAPRAAGGGRHASQQSERRFPSARSETGKPLRQGLWRRTSSLTAAGA